MFDYLKLFFKNEEQDNILHKHNLDKYHYLGYTNFTNIQHEFSCHYFLHKETENRSFHIVSNNSYANKNIYKFHAFYNNSILLWKTKEKQIWNWIQNPSDFLKDYMINKYNYIWNSKEKWWIQNLSVERQKYEDAKLKQQKEKKSNTNENVISFLKKD